MRNYRLFFFGQLASLMGTWMQTVALGWLVYDITDSPTQIGAVLAAQFFPTLVGSFYAGLIADRFDKRRLILAAQCALAAQAATLAAFTLTGHATLPVLYALALVQGIITTVDNPTRQSFVPELVPSSEVPNAIGLNSAAFNSARIIGPAVGGVLIQLVGSGICFALNAVSFVAVIAGLLAIDIDALEKSDRAVRAKGQLREGISYAWNDPTLRVVLGMIALTGLLAMNFNVVLPVVAKEVFGRGAETYGLMSAAMGVGSLAGALVAAGRGETSLRTLVGSAIAFGASLSAAALAPVLTLELLALGFTGLASITFNASANTMIQLGSRSDMRGRMVSLKTLFNLGSTPIGGPIVGWLGARYGARWSLGVGGIACFVAASGAIVVRRRDRPVNTELALTGDGASVGS